MQCKKRLTPFLTKKETVKDYNDRRVENKDYFEQGFYYIADKEREEEMIRNSIIINQKDNFGMLEHKDLSRFVGCCGASPVGQPNLVCGNCRAEVGRKTDDCLTPHYIKLDQNKVIFSQNEHDYYK